MKKKLKDLVEEVMVVLFLALGVYALLVFGIKTEAPTMFKAIFFVAMITWSAPLVRAFEDMMKYLGAVLNELKGGNAYEQH